jgi:hypothetical protein
MDAIRTDPAWTRAARSWLKAHAAAEKTNLALEKARFKLVLLAAGASAKGDGVSVTRFFRAGTISYGSIPELEGVALDDYRKPGEWQFRVTKESPANTAIPLAHAKTAIHAITRATIR